jgi:hypothetical protein
MGSGWGFFCTSGAAERKGKLIDTINLQNFENALMISRSEKKFFPEKNPSETRTTLREQLSYIWITFKELLTIGGLTLKD